MRSRNFKRWTSLLLVIAMIVSLFPTSALAAIPGTDGGARYKNMYLHSATNQRPIATYTYADNTNYFTTPATLASGVAEGDIQRLEWMLLTFAMDKGQNIDLQLYKLSEEYPGNEIELVPNFEEGTELIPEDFLVSLVNGGTGKNAVPAYLRVRRFTDNIIPAGADAATQNVQRNPDYERTDLNEFNYKNAPSTDMIGKGVYGRYGEPYQPVESTAALFSESFCQG